MMAKSRPVDDVLRIKLFAKGWTKSGIKRGQTKKQKLAVYNEGIIEGFRWMNERRMKK